MGSDQWDRTPPSPLCMVPSSEPTHHQTFFYAYNVALSSPMCRCHNVLVLLLPTRDLYPFSAHFWLFLCFIPAVPLLVIIATEEDYRRVVETFGYYFSLWMASVDTKKDQVWPLLATQASSKMYTALVCKVPTLHLISLVVWPDSLMSFSTRTCAECCILAFSLWKNIFQFFSEMQPNNTLHGRAVSYSGSIISSSYHGSELVLGAWEQSSLVPGPLSDFISQPWRKIGRRPGNIATSRTGNGGLG